MTKFDDYEELIKKYISSRSNEYEEKITTILKNNVEPEYTLILHKYSHNRKVLDLLNMNNVIIAERGNKLIAFINWVEESKYDFKKCVQCGIVENLKVCGKCERIKYCSKECQIKNWKTHKEICAIGLKPK
jgi:hypothetical protein